MENIDSQENFDIGFVEYSLDIMADIILGIILGVLVNVISDYVSKHLGFNMIASILFQFLLICIVLYLLKVDSKYMYSTWKNGSSYGIIFLTVFLAVQGNVISFFINIYDREEGKISIKSGIDSISSPKS